MRSSRRVRLCDIDHRLVAWNGPLLSIIGLPVDAIASVATHEGLVDMCTRLNGPMDADEPLAWLPNSASETISRRHHSSGRVIEVRRTPMPDGGMVMSFFDITGALRSAAALREANETLERRRKSERPKSVPSTASCSTRLPNGWPRSRHGRGQDGRGGG